MNESISIAIEHGIVKILVCNGSQIIDHKVVLANPRFFREGLINNSTRIAAIVETTLAEMKVGKGQKTKREVICALPGFQNTLRYMSLPKASGLDPKVVIPREAKRLMGISAETSHVLWHRLPDSLDLTRWVVMSATRRSTVAILETIEKAGLKAKAIDMRAFALARVVNQPDAVVAWVAQEGCEIVIIRDSTPLGQQSQFWGAEPMEGTVLADRLSQMVEQTIVTHDRNNPEVSISEEVPLYITGSPIAREPDVASRVADNLGRALGHIEAPIDVPPDFPIHDLIVNVGLCLREI